MSKKKEPSKKELQEIEKMIDNNNFFDEEFDDFKCMAKDDDYEDDYEEGY